MRKDTIPEYSITVMMNVKNAVIVTHFCLSLIRVISMSPLMKIQITSIKIQCRWFIKTHNYNYYDAIKFVISRLTIAVEN